MKIIITNEDGGGEHSLGYYQTATAKLINDKVRTRFCRWEGDDLHFSGCANKHLHNKMLILCSIFVDSKCGGCYTNFKNNVQLCGFEDVASVKNLYEFVSKIDLKTISISFE
jgi:hypothetical protein